MSCLRGIQMLVQIVFQSYKKSWSEVLGTKWQTCIQNLPGPKQRFLVISQNWCGDFPPNLVITLNLLCLPQIQIFIEILLSLVKKSVDPLFWTLGFEKVTFVIAKQPISWYFEGVPRRYFTKLAQPMRHDLFVAYTNFYQNPCEDNWEIRR